MSERNDSKNLKTHENNTNRDMSGKLVDLVTSEPPSKWDSNDTQHDGQHDCHASDCEVLGDAGDDSARENESGGEKKSGGEKESGGEESSAWENDAVGMNANRDGLETTAETEAGDDRTPDKSTSCCFHKGLWFAWLITLILCLGLSALSYTLLRKQNEIREQLNTRATVSEVASEVAREVAATSAPLAQRLDTIEPRLEPLTERIDQLDGALSLVRGQQQNAAHAVSRFDQAIIRLENEQRQISVLMRELRQERSIPAKSEQILNINALIGMAEDQLGLNRNPLQTRVLLTEASARLAQLSDPDLALLGEALRHDLALLEPVAHFNREEVLVRLTSLEARFIAALQTTAAPSKSASETSAGASVSSSPEVTKPAFFAATAQGWGDQIHVAWNHFTRYLGDYIRIQRHQPRREPLPEVVDVAALQLEFRQWLGIARVALFTQEYDAFGQAVDAIAQLLAEHTDLDQSGLRDEYDALKALRALASGIPAVTAMRSGPAARALLEVLPATAKQLTAGETE